MSKIPTVVDAVALRDYFVDNGVPAIVSEPASPRDHRVFVGMVSLDRFRRLIRGTSVELIP